MDHHLIQILILSATALVAGFVDAIAGGGGVITFPAFLLMGLPASVIVGTNKLVSVAGTGTAAYTYARKGMVQAEVVKTGLPFNMIGALAGAMLILAIPNEFLKPVISYLVIGVAVYCFVRPKIGIAHTYEGLNTKRKWITRVGSLLLGFYDGFFGPGTGIFLTFFFIRSIGCDYVRAAGNTKVLNCASNLVPLVYFLYFGNIRFDLGLPMVAANIVGARIGSKTAISRGSHFVKWIYLIMALMVAGKMIAGY